MTLFEGINLSAYWTYALGAFVIPNVPGYHVFMSSIPFPGLESQRNQVWVDTTRALFGFYLAGAKISMTCISNGYRTGPTPLFDKTVGILGADLLIGV